MGKKNEKPNNEVIKEFLKQPPKIPYWKLGKALLCHENTIIRFLREPLPEDRYTLFMETIKALKEKEARTAEE